ncbi:MAG: NUDIX domain-containing protein [Clostridia bacterium]|nr:NUDIX domain-containing protein [Clostridia bacterium]
MMMSEKNGICAIIRSRLHGESELSYADFTAKLIPNIPRQSVFGVRLPALRAFAKELENTGEKREFLLSLPHFFHEENLLHTLLINTENELPAAITALRCFLPCVDNWAVCDTLRPEAIKRHFKEALPFIFSCIESPLPYTVRFGILMLMTYGLKEDFSLEFHERTAKVESADYYVNMMRAWYFATALAFRYDETLPYLAENRLNAWTHNKSIQKAVESFRISSERKVFLKSLRRASGAGKARSGEKSFDNEEKPPLDVAAAVIRSGERMLICKRPANKARGGLWEFPGGKLEAGETAREALCRECPEELDADITVTSHLTTLTHFYHDLTVRLFVFECGLKEGSEPKAKEPDEIALVLPGELKKYALCEADKKIAELICSLKTVQYT